MKILKRKNIELGQSREMVYHNAEIDSVGSGVEEEIRGDGKEEGGGGREGGAEEKETGGKAMGISGQ